jgi:molybdenum cofactor guanylyltransferase
MQPGQHSLTAFILAGGNSSRMGSDKAFASLKGKSFLERALQAARALTPELMIVGEASKYGAYAPVVQDIFRNRGPLAGIHSALTATATELNLILGVDMPFLKPALLKYLHRRAREEPDAMVTIPKAAGGWQPLCAVYRSSFGREAERALRAGCNKIDSLFAAVRITVVEEKELAKAGFSVDVFRNVNTPQELKEASEQV